MNVYEESPLFSGRKGVAFTAVILLHLAFGFALYSELGAQIRKALDPAPIDLIPVEPVKEPAKPPPRMPVINEFKLYVPLPKVPPLMPQAEPEITVEREPPDPPEMIPSTATQPKARAPARMDPKHPLKIGEAYYPDASRRANEMGRCVVTVTVAVDGRIVAGTIQSSTGFNRLDQACLNAVRGQRMLPAVEDGKPIESAVSIPILWNLSER
jgi:periplasmic protein TonB